MKPIIPASRQLFGSAIQQVTKVTTSGVRCTLCGHVNPVQYPWVQTPARCNGCGALTGPLIYLLDTSGSMKEMDGLRRRIDHLTDALRHILPQTPGAKLIAYSTIAREIGSLWAIGRPQGGTALHLAIRAAAMHSPSHVMLFSDGECDCERTALESMHYLKCRLDTIYCGPDRNAAAIDFLNRLARFRQGTATVHSFRRPPAALLVPTLKKLLCLPPT